MNHLLTVIPNPDPLPVAPGWLSFLSYLTYFLHLIAVGIMFGVSLFAVVGHLKGKTNETWRLFGQRMSKLLPFTIAFAVNLGVAPLLFIQVLYGNFFYSASIIIGIPWLLLILLLIGAYYSAYWLVFKKANNLKRKSLLSVIISLILTWAAFMLVNINTLMLVPGRWKTYFARPNGMNLNLSEPTLFPRLILYLFLMLSIGAIFTALFYKIKYQEKETKTGFHFAATAAGYFSLLSIPAFLYFLFSLPVEIKPIFLGESVPWLILAAIFPVSLLLAGFLSFKKKIVLSAPMLVSALVVFLFIRNHIRYLYLKPFSEKFSLVSGNTQYGVMILFFVVLAAGLILLAYLLTRTAREIRKHGRSINQ